MKTDLGLKGKVVIVTGASGGIGKATANFLASCGIKVVRTDIREDKDHNDLFVTADISQLKDVENLYDKTLAEYGTLYGVVNCGAIIIRQKDLYAIDLEQLEKEIRINQIGSFFIARQALKILSKKKDGDGGRIILFSSQGGFTGGFHGSVTYSMTKASLSALIKSFARFGAPYDITVNLVAPGAIDTPMLKNDVSEKNLQEFKEKIPLGRFGQPDEVASTCAFLLSSWSSYITGGSIHVNGGQYMA